MVEKEGRGAVLGRGTMELETGKWGRGDKGSLICQAILIEIQNPNRSEAELTEGKSEICTPNSEIK
jgi:hypothetical protein